MDKKQQTKQYTASEVMAKGDFYYSQDKSSNYRLFLEGAKKSTAYCINPDGSVQFNLEAWDGK